MRAKNITVISILAAVRATVTANGVGKDISEFEGDVKFTLDSSAGGGADHTMDTKLQHSDDDVTYVDVLGGVFVQVTNAGPAFESLIVSADGLKKFVRGAESIAGTAPTFDRALSMVGEKKYN
jgi:predicted small secreted protein